MPVYDTKGTATVSVSLNDANYSNACNGLSGSVTQTASSATTWVCRAAGNLGHKNLSPVVTPLARNKASIYELTHTYAKTPCTVTRYGQVTPSPPAPPPCKGSRFFIRSDLAYVDASSLTAGPAFGTAGTQTNQFRSVAEVSVMF